MKEKYHNIAYAFIILACILVSVFAVRETIQNSIEEMKGIRKQMECMMMLSSRKTLFINKHKYHIITINSKIDDTEIAELLGTVFDNCERLSLKTSLVLAVIEQESGFTKDCESNKGAVGYMQIIPSTGDIIALRMGKLSYDLRNTKDNIDMGCYFLAMLLSYYDEPTALSAYYAGNRIHLGKEYAKEVKDRKVKYEL